ncbi:putative sodium-dependent multivitamin transporter isoform X2 [Thrips palmi]|nr:putative sodium-dependent multivitamin transporter isoform X2 [Thrips palmi]
MDTTTVAEGLLEDDFHTMGWVDISVFAIMLAVSTLIGVYFAYCSPQGNESEADYLVGGRSMGTIPVALSLFASFISGIALLGYPAEVYVFGGQVVYNALSYPLTGLLLGYQLLPVFRNLRTLSVYEYLDRRFSRKARFIASCLFLVSHIVWLPIVIYVPALAFEQVTRINLHVVGPVVCVICIYYTTVGGVKAVVWTDAVQAVMMLLCVGLVVAKGVMEVGGLGTVWQRNMDTTRLEAPVWDLDPTTRHTIFSLILGGVVRHTADLGLSQSIIQRYMALPSLRACYRATAIFMVCTVCLNLLACFCGFTAAAYYHDCDPLTVGIAQKRDQIVPMFVLDVLANVPGLTGLFIAGVFSAAMSSLSTGLNSISAVVLEDGLRSMAGRSPSERQTRWLLRGVVVGAGLVCLALMFVVEHLGMVVQLNASLSAMAAAPQFTLFIAGLFLPWVNTRAALLGAAVAAAMVGVTVIGAQANILSGALQYTPKPVSVDGCPHLAPPNVTLAHLRPHDNSEVFWLFRISYLWYQPLAILTGLLVASVAALAGWRNDLADVDPRLVAPVSRRFLPEGKYRGDDHGDDPATQEALLLELRTLSAAKDAAKE